MDQVEVWYGQRKVAELPRLRGRRKHRVDYRHIIDWLVRKPGAFENYRYRDELFPTSRFRMAFDALEEQHGQQGSKEYLRILELAAKESESKVDEALRTLLQQSDDSIHNPISVDAVETLLGVTSGASRRDVKIVAIDLRIFDRLYTEVLQ
jgi:hypothetical protein